ncbi:hypothetical protein Tco_0919015 [Tanacetum coccineum]
MSTIRVEYEWASPRGHVLDECSKKIDLDVLLNLKKPTQAIRGIPVGSKPKSTFIYRPVQSIKKTDKAPAKPKDNCGCMNSTSTQEPEQVEGSGKKDINMSVPSRSCYKTPISVVSSIHGSSPVASDSHNSTPLAEKINKNEKLRLDGKLILVDDDGKPLNKVDSVAIDSDSESEVEVAYNEIAQFMASGCANDARLYEDEDYDIYDTYDLEGLTKRQLAFCDTMDINLHGHSRR